MQEQRRDNWIAYIDSTQVDNVIEEQVEEQTTNSETVIEEQTDTNL
jgi:hypothetical protein